MRDHLVGGESVAERGQLTPATRAVVPVLYGGRAVDLSPIRADLDAQGIAVIEDAAHAFGSWHGDRRVGATPETAVTCFSFGPIKNLTCGTGGMLIPIGPDQAEAARRLRLLGVVEGAGQRAASTSYTVAVPGYRYAMSAINAAIGGVQLGRFTESDTARRRLWRTYRDALADLVDDGVIMVDVDVDRSVPSLCVVRVPDRERVFRRLRDRRVGVQVHYPPDHLQPAFAAGRRPLPVTEQTAEQIMTLPFHQHLVADDIDRVASLLRQAVRRPS